MAWTLSDSKANSSGGSATSISVTLDGGAPAQGTLLVATLHTDDALASTVTPPTGFSQAVANQSASRTTIQYYKVAGASEGSTYQWDSSVSTNLAVGLHVFSGETFDVVGNTATAGATNTDTITVGPITAAAGALVVAGFFQEGSATDPPTFSAGWTAGAYTIGAGDDTATAYKESAGASESCTHTLASSTTRQTGTIVEYRATAGGTPVTLVLPDVL